MLSVITEFPQVGAVGFLRTADPGVEPEPIRIIRRNRDGTALISLTDAKYPHEIASGNKTVDLGELAPTRAEAMPPLSRTRATPPKRASRRRTAR